MGRAPPIEPHDHVIGRPSAPVQVVEYGDYACADCARAHHEMTDVLRRVGADIRYAFRHFPLGRAPRSLLAAQAAEAAGRQGRFWPMHSVLFENRHALDEPDLVTYAETLGLDVRRFVRELHSGIHLPRVQRDLHTGVRADVRNTPAFFVDGVRQARWDAESLVRTIREERTSPPSNAHR